MDCTRTAAQSRKSNLFRIAVFNHIFHFVQRQRQPNSPTPATGHHQCRRHRHRHHQALLAPPRQDSMLHSPFSILHCAFSFWLYKFAMLGISGGVVCAELLDKKGSNAVPLCSLFCLSSPSISLSFYFPLPPLLVFFSASFCLIRLPSFQHIFLLPRRKYKQKKSGKLLIA